MVGAATGAGADTHEVDHEGCHVVAGVAFSALGRDGMLVDTMVGARVDMGDGGHKVGWACLPRHVKVNVICGVRVGAQSCIKCVSCACGVRENPHSHL